MKLKALAAAALVAAAGGVSAATVSQTLFNGLQQLSDNSAEELINAPGSAANDTTLDVGDRLRGIFTIETVEQSPSPTRFLGGGSTNNELSGIFDITVTGKVAAGPSVIPGQTNYLYTFGVTSSFASALGIAGAMVAFYEDSAAEYSRLAPGCTTTGAGGDCEALINDGSLLWVAGFSGAGGTAAFGEGWTAFAFTDDVSIVGGISPPGNGGLFNLALANLLNNSTVDLGKVSCNTFGPGLNVEYCGSGSLLGTEGLDTPYDSFDNVDFTINVIPEPSSIALAGLALLGLGAAARRRKA